MQEHIQNLHMCQSRLQFETLAQLVLKDWRARNEHALATWFEKELYPMRWCINDTGIPGQDPNTQPLESDHRNSKRSRHGMNAKVPLGVFIKESISRKLLFAAQKLENKTFHFTTPPGEPHRDVLVRANELLDTDNNEDHTKIYCNYFEVKSANVPGFVKISTNPPRLVEHGSVVFNSSQHMWQRNVDWSMTKLIAT
jgi:hypothetical protein